MASRSVLVSGLLMVCLTVALAMPATAVAADPNREAADTTSAARPSTKARGGTRTAVAPVSIFNARLATQVGHDGRFNLGAFPDPATGAPRSASWSLAYSWPDLPESSVSTLRIDGADYVYGVAGVGVEAPTNIDAKTNRSRWQIGDVEVTQTIQLVANPRTGQEDAAKISYLVRNVGVQPRSVGLRVLVDVEMRENDGPLFSVPGQGLIGAETQFVGAAVPNAIETVADVADSVHRGVILLKSGGATPPDRLVLARWPGLRNASFDYAVEPSASLAEDSAYAVYWNPATLAPGASRSYSTLYGLTASSAPTSLPTTWYFAEGYTGEGFDQYLTIQNPNPTDAAVTVTYFLGGGQPPLVKRLTAPANRRTTVTVHEQAVGVGRGQEVAAKVESTNGVSIIVERPMYFRYTGSMGTVTGGHTVVGATAPRTDWYFAEGYTGSGFDEYLTMLNPTGTDATVRLTYFLRGSAPITRTLTARANARTTLPVHDLTLGVGRGREVAARVESTNGVGLVVERPIYFRYDLTGGGGAVDGGHTVVGTDAPRAIWYFAEGYTGQGFDEYLTLLNPNAVAAEVTITYYLANGATPRKVLTVPGASRTTVAVHGADFGVGRDQAVAALVHSTNGVGIIAERPIYFRYGPGWSGGHSVVGAVSPSTLWHLAEGYTGAGFDQFLTILNPNDSDPVAQVRITYYLADGSPLVKTVTAPAMARTTVVVHDATQGVGRNQAVSAKVESANGVGIVVERPIYFDYGPGWTGGHNVMGYAP